VLQVESDLPKFCLLLIYLGSIERERSPEKEGFVPYVLKTFWSQLSGALHCRGASAR